MRGLAEYMEKEEARLSRRRKFKVGDKVWLKANRKEGWWRQAGIVDGSDGNGMYVVRVRPDRYDRLDDGLREVHVRYMSRRH